MGLRALLGRATVSFRQRSMIEIDDFGGFEMKR